MVRHDLGGCQVFHADDETGGREIRVLVVDDHEVVAASLRMVLDAEPDLSTVGHAATLGEARSLVSETRPDVILLDHRLPDGDGVAAIAGLRALHPAFQVVVLTASEADHVLLAAVEAGAAGFLSKSGGIDGLTAAVRSAAVGESVIAPTCWLGCSSSPTVAKRLVGHSPSESVRCCSWSPRGSPTPPAPTA